MAAFTYSPQTEEGPPGLNHKERRLKVRNFNRKPHRGYTKNSDKRRHR